MTFDMKQETCRVACPQGKAGKGSMWTPSCDVRETLRPSSIKGWFHSIVDVVSAVFYVKIISNQRPVSPPQKKEGLLLLLADGRGFGILTCSSLIIIVSS